MAARLALLASYPPPFGGVANHVQRLSALLDARGLEHVIYNAVSRSEGGRVISVSDYRRAWMARYAATARERLLYIFSARLEVWVWAAAMVELRRKRVIIRLRNAALHDYLADPMTRAIARATLQRATRVVAVSQRLAQAAEEAGVPPSRILHQPGFLPPRPPTADMDEVSALQRAFLSSHRPIIAANGKVDFSKETDLYGLDHMVEMVGRLRAEHPQLGLAVSFWDHLPSDDRYLTRLKRRAAELGVEGNILFHTASRPFVPVLREADVFVRPTCTDGDANSVREALFLGVPAVASDAVERPGGTILHRTRDLDDLTARVTAVLAGPRKREPKLDVVDRAAVERYLQMLDELSSP